MNISVDIRRLICKRFDVAEDRVTFESSFIDDLGADSLALVEFTLALEEMFDIEIADDEVGRIHTVQDAVRSVENCVRARRAQ